MRVGIAADHDDLGARSGALDLQDGGKALLDTIGVGGHPEILQNDGGLMPPQHAHGLLPGGGAVDVKIVECPFQLPLQFGIVLDDQQPTTPRAHLCLFESSL